MTLRQCLFQIKALDRNYFLVSEMIFVFKKSKNKLKYITHLKFITNIAKLHTNCPIRQTILKN